MYWPSRCDRFDDLPGEPILAGVETGQTFLGLVGLLDLPRPEAKAAIGLCQTVEVTSSLAASAVVWAGVELEKWVIRRGRLYRN